MTTAVKGRVWPAEWQKFNDPITSVPVWQLTNYFAHSFHIYFTNDGWYDNGNKLLFGSDRGNATNLYSLDLQNGTMTQLTDNERNEQVGIQGTFINPTKQEAYFTKDNKMIAIDLQTYEERTLYEAPKGYSLGNVSCTADGLSVCTAIKEDLSDRIPTNLGAGYGGFEETAKAHPHCQILSIPVAGGEAKLLHEEKIWIGHVNTSPTQPHLLSFCHEGPWHLVDHRIWCLDLNSGEHWKVREAGDSVFVGHEYWFADGIHIGYHGYQDSLDNKEGKFIGSIRYDNSDCEEFKFPFQNMHVHSNDETMIVGDGQQTSAYPGEQFQDTIGLWKKVDGRLEGPRILCKHRGSFHIQTLHVHPRFSPDGKKVLFTSDNTGYGNLYLAEVPEFDTLPKSPEWTADE